MDNINLRVQTYNCRVIYRTRPTEIWLNRSTGETAIKSMLICKHPGFIDLVGGLETHEFRKLYTNLKLRTWTLKMEQWTGLIWLQNTGWLSIHQHYWVFFCFLRHLGWYQAGPSAWRALPLAGGDASAAAASRASPGDILSHLRHLPSLHYYRIHGDEATYLSHTAIWVPNTHTHMYIYLHIYNILENRILQKLCKD